MRVMIQRAWSDHRATLGILSIQGMKHNPFFTIENPLRAVPKDSRIPAGQYKCKPYSGSKYEDVYIVENVPGRSAILFHWGNTEKDTAGCILLGLNCGMMGGDPAVFSSKAAFEEFRRLIGINEFTLHIFNQTASV